MSKSLCFALDDFYKEITYFFTSSLSGKGLKELTGGLGELRSQYFEGYYQDLVERMNEMDLKNRELIEEKKEKFNEKI